MADVVTGKLDVRAAAASLTYEPDVSEPLEPADILTDELDLTDDTIETEQNDGALIND